MRCVARGEFLAVLITAEFANDKSRETFPVGDGKYYSRAGVTEAKGKRRLTSQYTSTGVQYTNENMNSLQ